MQGPFRHSERLNSLWYVLWIILNRLTLYLPMSCVCDPGETNLPFCLLLLQVLENFRIEVQSLRDVGTKFSLILVPEKPIFFNFQPLKQDLGPTMTRMGDTV